MQDGSCVHDFSRFICHSNKRRNQWSCAQQSFPETQRSVLWLLFSTMCVIWTVYHFAGIACWLERLTRDRKVASSNPGRSSRRIFFSRVNFVCWFLSGVRSTPVLPWWHVKNPGHSAKRAGGRLHLNTCTPLTQRSRSGLTMPLSRNCLGTYRETSSHATRQGTLGHSRLRSLSRLKSGISVSELISTLKKKEKKSANGEWIVQFSPKILAREEKATTTTNNNTTTTTITTTTTTTTTSILPYSNAYSRSKQFEQGRVFTKYVFFLQNEVAVSRKLASHI